MVFAANPAASSWNGAGTGDPGFLESLAGASGMPAPTTGQPLPLLGATGAREAAGGVHIAQVVADPAPALKRYDPGHPDAGPDGYVAYPDINPLTEMVDLMGATRAYGLNGSAVQAEKGMITSALEIAKTVVHARERGKRDVSSDESNCECGSWAAPIRCPESAGLGGTAVATSANAAAVSAPFSDLLTDAVGEVDHLKIRRRQRWTD